MGVATGVNRPQLNNNKYSIMTLGVGCVWRCVIETSQGVHTLRMVSRPLHRGKVLADHTACHAHTCCTPRLVAPPM